MTPASANAGIDDLQIDWRIPAGAIDEAALNANEHRQASVELVPARMFVPDTDVLSGNGEKLLPAGTPLYLMIGRNFMLCSQSAAPKGYEGRKRRICLRDTNGDGELDSYFTRSRGRSFLSGDKMWFAMNSEIPSRMEPVQSIKLSEADRTDAPEKASLLLVFGARKNGQATMAVLITRDARFTSRCRANPGFDSQDGYDAYSCMMPDFVVLTKPVGTEDDRSFQFRYRVPMRELRVRFDVAPRLLGARLMSGMYIE